MQDGLLYPSGACPFGKVSATYFVETDGRTAPGQGISQHRAQHLLHPPQPLDHLGCKCAVAEHLAEAWDKVTSMDGARELQAGGEQTMKFLGQAGQALGIKLN